MSSPMLALADPDRDDPAVRDASRGAFDARAHSAAVRCRFAATCLRELFPAATRAVLTIVGEADVDVTDLGAVYGPDGLLWAAAEFRHHRDVAAYWQAVKHDGRPRVPRLHPGSRRVIAQAVGDALVDDPGHLDGVDPGGIDLVDVRAVELDIVVALAYTAPGDAAPPPALLPLAPQADPVIQIGSRIRVLTAVAERAGCADHAQVADQLGCPPDPHDLAALQVALTGRPARLVQPRPGVYELTAAGLRDLARAENLAAVLMPADPGTVGPVEPDLAPEVAASMPGIAVAGAQAFLSLDAAGVLVLSLHVDTGEVAPWLVRADGCIPMRVTVNGDPLFVDDHPALARLEASAAERGFAALTDPQQRAAMREIFEILEYDADGLPGIEWSADTVQNLGDLFVRFGIEFTSRDDTEDAASAADSESTALDWTVAPGGLGRNAASGVRHLTTGLTGRYGVQGAGDGRWTAALTVGCGAEVPQASTALGDFEDEDEAMAAAERHEFLLGLAAQGGRR